MQPMPPQQQYPQHAPMQPAMPVGPGVAVAAREPKRNLVLMAIGAFLLLIGFLVFCLFAYNLWHERGLCGATADDACHGSIAQEVAARSGKMRRAGSGAARRS